MGTWFYFPSFLHGPCACSLGTYFFKLGNISYMQKNTEKNVKIITYHFHPGFILYLYVNVSTNHISYWFMGLKIYIHDIILWTSFGDFFFPLNIRFWNKAIEISSLLISVFLISRSFLVSLPSLSNLNFTADHLIPPYKQPSSFILTAIWHSIV